MLLYVWVASAESISVPYVVPLKVLPVMSKTIDVVVLVPVVLVAVEYE